MNLSKIKSLLFAITGMFVASVSVGQTWEIGYQTMTFVDASRNNRQIETELFYPADVTGYNVPLGTPSIQRYPVIVLGHDEAVAWNNYAYIWNRFATQGFIVAIPKTEMGVPMDVVEYAKDMAFVVSQFNVMRFTVGSFFFQRFNGKSCVMGHGVGGSAATFALQYYPLITTMVSLAAKETVPSAINAASLVTRPSVVIGGGKDCEAPIATNQLPMFNNIDSDCKTFINMFEATHCQFSQDFGSCANNMINCLPSNKSWQFTTGNTNYLLISFLRFYMKSNAPALDKFEWKLGSKTVDWSYIFTCLQISPRIVSEDNSSENTTTMNFYPNPVNAGSELNMVVASEESASAQIIICNLMGQVVVQKEIPLEESEQAVSIATDQIKSGYYMVTVINNEGRFTKPLIIQ